LPGRTLILEVVSFRTASLEVTIPWADVFRRVD